MPNSACNRISKNIQNIIASFLIITFSAVLISGCGGKPEIAESPWIDNQYTSISTDSLQILTDKNDSLAAMTLGWRLMQTGDTAVAARILRDFNVFYDKADPNLNYLTGKALAGIGQDSLAILYLDQLYEYESLEDAGLVLAGLLKDEKRYERAIEVYQDMKGMEKEARNDSILACKAMMGDTLSAYKVAHKAFEKGDIAKTVSYYNRIVSMSRGVSPPQWSYEAGKAYLIGNNPTRAAVLLENADAETSFVDLSISLGRAYIRLEVFDSAASKYEQALQMGDSSQAVFEQLSHSLAAAGDWEKAMRYGRLGIRMHPEQEKLYYAPSQYYFQTGQYDSIIELTSYARNQIEGSHRIDAYHVAAHYLKGDSATADSLLSGFIEKYKWGGGKLIEAAALFEQSLNRPDIAQRLRERDPGTKFPETQGFLVWYHSLKDQGLSDSARTLLEIWLTNDSIEVRRELMHDFYKQEYGHDFAGQDQPPEAVEKQ